MPIFFQQEVDNDTRLAVWHINEEEAFFDVPLQRDITHPHKRLQHRAGRYLLRHLFPEFPLELIAVADTRRPYLADEAFHFSISHCADYAAAIVSRTRRVGIDVELPEEKVLRIRKKFLSDQEAMVLAPLDTSVGPLLASTMVWNVKEAAFKWYGAGKVDFMNDMPVKSIEHREGQFRFNLYFGKEVQKELGVQAILLLPVCLAFVVGAKEHGSNRLSG